MGGLAEAILEKALRALESADLALAESVRTDDLAIDQVDVDIASAVLHLLALQAPLAEDLRRVTASKTIAIYLERVGDLSRNLAGCAGRLARSQAVPAPARILELGGLVRAQLRGALDAFANQDSEEARRVLERDDEVDELQDELVREQIAAVASNPELAAERVALILIAEHLERVGAHATNIAEDVILIVEAENVKHREKLRGQTSP